MGKTILFAPDSTILARGLRGKGIGKMLGKIFGNNLCPSEG